MKDAYLQHPGLLDQHRRSIALPETVNAVPGSNGGYQLFTAYRLRRAKTRYELTEDHWQMATAQLAAHGNGHQCGAGLDAFEPLLRRAGNRALQNGSDRLDLVRS